MIMIDTKTFIRSAYFEEVKGSLSFLKCVSPLVKMVDLPFGKRKCIPTVKTIAGHLELPPSTVEREIERLLNLKWARKYKEGVKSLYVIGVPDNLFMSTEVSRLFSQADRKKDGAVTLLEWRWLPLSKWSGTTLWKMIQDKFEKRGRTVVFAKAKGRAQIQSLITEVGIKTAKAVADFFVANYAALKIHFSWYGLPNPGLFKGFFHTIKDIKERGMPQAKGSVHNRGKQTAMAKDVVSREWVAL